MGIIAWIVLGLAAGLLANMLIPGKRSQGLIFTCLIGIAGALGGGWVATKLFHIHSLQGFFNLSTWLTAIAGAAILLLAFQLVTADGRRACYTDERATGWGRRASRKRTEARDNFRASPRHGRCSGRRSRGLSKTTLRGRGGSRPLGGGPRGLASPHHPGVG
jgi:uncharacterized membrane protein YeaQ/YmgE (transglycosylase-associated protein family)